LLVSKVVTISTTDRMNGIGIGTGIYS